MIDFETELRRLRVFVIGPSSEPDLDEELNCHVELLTADNIADGMSVQDARADALRRFGDVKRIKRCCRAVRRGSLSGATLLLIGIVAACGAVLWASPYAPQVNVLGQLLVLTVFLFRLLMYVRAWPALAGSEASPALELTLFESTSRIPKVEPVDPRLDRRFSAFARVQALRIVALCAVIACCLCVVVVASSAKAFSNHLRHVQKKQNADIAKFVGTWVLTVGDIYDLKDSPLLNPFRDLPQGLDRKLLLAEVIIEFRDGKPTGKRLLYRYAPKTDSSSPLIEKGEVELVNLHASGNVLSGDVTRPEGERLPGGWELKLTGEKEAEVRVTGNDVPEEQKKFVLKLHRLDK